MRARQVDGVDHRDRAARPRAARRDARRGHAESCSSTAGSRTAACRRPRPTTARASRLAVEHLVALGHTADRARRRAAGALDRPTTATRASSRRCAHAGARARSGARALVGRRSRSPKGARLCEELLAAAAASRRSSRRNDLMALGCYDVFAERGIALPGGRSRSSASTTCRSPSASTRRSRRSASRTTRSARPPRELLLERLQERATRAPREVRLAAEPGGARVAARSSRPSALDNPRQRPIGCTRLQQTFAAS